ncbi:MAG TPA: type II and III secretion system protein family protein [Phycisphaerae bacterium]|nr:type II and III secretion system protein family protein [Phycisphaerae bacterium]
MAKSMLQRWMVPACIAALCAPLCVRADDDDQQVPLQITERHSQIIDESEAITRLSVTDPTVVDVKLLSPYEVLISGLAPGTTDLFVWSAKGIQQHKEINVVVDAEQLQNDLNQMFPDDQITVKQTASAVVIEGEISSANDITPLHEYLDLQKVKYVDLTSLSGVQQVQLRVIVAEANRTAIRELGFNFYSNGTQFFGASTPGPSESGALTPISIGTPTGASATGAVTPFSFLSDAAPSTATSLLLGVPGANLEIFIQALVENEYVRILAEPTLTAESGQEASFLVGGEFPIPVVQGTSSNNGITIQYQQYGVSLQFRPEVLGENRIRLHVGTQVSELSSGLGSVTISGFVIPAILTRQAETTLVLGSGQSFAMAGLISKETQANSSAVPVLGQVPILGPLFRSMRFQSDDTELVVLVTANVVSPSSQAIRSALPGDLYKEPTDWQFFMNGQITGTTPPYLAPTDSAMLKSEGYSQLRGPGAWATFDTPLEPSEAPLNGASTSAAMSSAPASKQ